MVLVTGASGFVGRHLVRHLSGQGQKVRALYNQHVPDNSLASLPGVEWKQCDLLDIYDVTAAMEGITDIYHCAAIVSFDTRKMRHMLHTNPESTANVVNEALDRGIRKMVHVSSVAALGRTNDGGREINEEAEWVESKYNSVYGLSKHLSEMEVWRGIGEGLDAVIINPGIILGPGLRKDLSMQLMKIVHREFPFYSKGITSWVDVDDVTKIMVLLMESDVCGERFIISNGNFEYRQVLTLMANALNKKPPRFRAGSFLAGVGWRLSMLRSYLLKKPMLVTRETVNSSSAHSNYSSIKFSSSFPTFSFTPLPVTVERMARSFINSDKN